MTDHARHRDDVGAYLLGALNDLERHAFERHLSGCSECQEELERLRPAAEALPGSVVQLDPPPGLKQRLMAEVEGDSKVVPLEPRRRRPTRLLAVAAVLLLGIVHNRAIDGLRRSSVHDRRREPFEGVEERFEARERTDVEVARREEARSVRGALETLPDEQRQTIELAYFGGFTHTQIAELLHEPVGTVKGRMRLGLDKMRRQLVEGVA